MSHNIELFHHRTVTGGYSELELRCTRQQERNAKHIDLLDDGAKFPPPVDLETFKVI